MKNVPLWKCRNCSRFHGQCTLLDLDPCDYVPIDKKLDDERAKNIFLTVITIFACALIALIVIFAKPIQGEDDPTPEEVHQSAVQLLRQQHRNELTEWQELIMAIAFTESRFRPDAVGGAGDSGILQLLPIYVEEVNRVSGSEYTIDDAFDIGKSIAMYEAMQWHYNPSKDLDEAIRHHNKSPRYRAAVLENLEMIKRYEAVRSIILDSYDNNRK